MREAGGGPTILEDAGGEPLHVIAVSRDLSWLRHAHPRPAQPGAYTFDITFPKDGRYEVFAVAAPRGRERQTLRTSVVVGEAVESPAASLSVSERERRFGSYAVRLTTKPEPLISGQWATLTFRLEREGTPVTNLRSDAGAGHLVILDASATNFVYAHSTDGEAMRGVRARSHQPATPPTIREHEHGGDDRGPDVQFHALFPVPGRYKVWAEFAPGEDHLTVDFVVDVVGPKARATPRAGRGSTRPAPPESSRPSS
jgi:hypothetical protein